MTFRVRTLAAVGAVGILALTGCAGGDGGEEEAELGSEANPVKLGVVGASNEYWDTYVDAAADEGISLEIVDFTEYTQPNPALTEGELHMNQFQHIIFLADYNTSTGEDVQPIGATVTYPLGLYSQEFDSVADLPDGGTVLIPDDTANMGRALLLLQSEGLIALEEGGGPYSTLEDIIEDESTVEVKTLAADLIAPSLPDADAAILNNDYLQAAEVTVDDAIATDDPNAPEAIPYVNIFATRAEDTDNEVLNELVEIYQTDQDVIDGVLEVSAGTAIPATTPKEDLQASLAEVEAEIPTDG